MVTLESAVKWSIGIGFWLFSMGGTYMMIKYRLDSHEEKLKVISDKMDKFASKEDFENRIKSIEWRLNRSR